MCAIGSMEILIEWICIRRLEETGYGVGHRILELSTFREKLNKREIKLIGILQVCEVIYHLDAT
jgi:hypothetical protein